MFFRQAIVTKYLSCTDRRGSRVKATAPAGSITLEWDNALNIEANHSRAAEALAAKLDWKGAWVGGGLPGSGFAFVNFDNPTIEPGDVAFVRR